MDVSQALRDAENSLRDFIVLILSQSGQDWQMRCGVPPERIEKWKERKAAEEKRQRAGIVDERLIYYADFYDLGTILRKNWSGKFAEAFGDWKSFETYLGVLEKLRDTDAHRRELLPHQKHLILGISGEIRNKIVRFRSKMETPNDCFPRIECVRDNLGNVWVPGGILPIKIVNTGMVLHPGDTLEFVVTATDPEDAPMEFSVDYQHTLERSWQSDPNLRFPIKDCDISRLFALEVAIRSSRAYHAVVKIDDSVNFHYCVLPNKTR